MCACANGEPAETIYCHQNRQKCSYCNRGYELKGEKCKKKKKKKLDVYIVFDVSKYAKYLQRIKKALNFIEKNVKNNEKVRLGKGHRITLILFYDYKDRDDNHQKICFRYQSTKLNDFNKKIQSLKDDIDHPSNVPTNMIYSNVKFVLKDVSQFIRDDCTNNSKFKKRIVILFTNGGSLCKDIFSNKCLGPVQKSDKLEKTTFETISYSASEEIKQDIFEELIS